MSDATNSTTRPTVEPVIPAAETPPPTGDKPWLRQAVSFLGFSWSAYLITVIVFEIVIFAILLLTEPDDPEKGMSTYAKIATFFGIWIFISILHFTILVLKRLFGRLWQRRAIEGDIKNLQKELESKDFFTTLIRINFRYIDKYYLQTQVQADKSFTLSAAAAVVSLILILAGVAMLFFDTDGKKTNPAYVTTGAGVLGEFIATVFFYLYNRTVSEMSKYHQKLVLTQNISLALRIADGLPPESKADAQLKLIECLSKDINMYLSMQAFNDSRESAPADVGRANGGGATR